MKYRNKKVEVDGIVFDSKKEAKRWQELRLLEQAGEIGDLRRQVKFELIPSQYDTVGHTKTGKPIKRCYERPCTYIADFAYVDAQGKPHVEDTKGMRTANYIIKRKLMAYIHGIRVEEL